MDDQPRKWHQHPVAQLLLKVWAALLLVQLLVVLLTDYNDLPAWIASLVQ